MIEILEGHFNDSEEMIKRAEIVSVIEILEGHFNWCRPQWCKPQWCFSDRNLRGPLQLVAIYLLTSPKVSVIEILEGHFNISKDFKVVMKDVSVIEILEGHFNSSLPKKFPIMKFQ